MEIKDYTARMQKSVDSLKEELSSIRTGRASVALFDKVKVQAYGTATPLNQVASVSVPEARMVMITPYDKTLIGDIEKGILKAELGLNPSNDGKVIRISIPPLTQDRRKELSKQAKSVAENSRVAVRNIRRDANEVFKKQQKAGEITEDEQKTLENDLQKQTDKFIADIQKVCDAKEKEIMEG